MNRPRSASFAGLRAANAAASRRAAKGSAKRDTRAEIALQLHLKACGLRFRTDAAELPGRPDIVFDRGKVVVFVDGDFWHGRAIKSRLARLAVGHNAAYWIRKILTNRARDRRTRAELRQLGWKVVRAWESDIKRNADRAAEKIAALLKAATLARARQRRQAVARKRATAP